MEHQPAEPTLDFDLDLDMPMPTIDQVDDDELSMVDFFDAEELLNEEKIQIGQNHQLFERRASIEFAKQLWSSSSEDAESAMSEDESEPFKINPSSTIDESNHSSSCCNTGGFDHQLYNQLVAKLAESMNRSEQSRAQIIQQRRSYQQGGHVSKRTSMTSCPSENDSSSSCGDIPTTPSRSPSLSSSQHHPAHPQHAPQLHQQMPSYPMAGLSSFLNGSQSTLTSGLEQSRRQLAEYMSQMSNRCHGMTSPMA